MPKLFVLLVLFAASFGVRAMEPVPELAPLSPFVGKTWQSVSGGFPGESDFHDVAKWEWAMDGRAVRITHSINEGAYGGESLIHYDADQKKIIFRYVTTAGFYTDGVIKLVDGGFEAAEQVKSVGPTGPTETLAGYQYKDGRMIVWAKVKGNDGWSKPSETIYEEAPDAKVIFKP